jgi:hypothetical protein
VTIEGQVEIVGGLKADAREVVVGGAAKLADGVPVTLKPTGTTRPAAKST